MSSEPPSGPPAGDRPTEPFTRGRIVWGRPPRPVFQVGPLPRSANSVPVGRPAPRPTRGAGILTGSMVPPARPATESRAVFEEIAPEPVAAEPVAPVEIEAVFEPEVAAPPEPEPVAPEPVVAREIVIEPDAPEPAVTVPPPLSTEAKPAAKPRSLPSVVVTPAIYASVGAAMQKVAKGDRWPIVAGVAALVVIGGFIWLATLPGPQPIAPAPTPLIADAPLVEEPLPPVEASAPAVTRPAPTRSAATPAPSTPVRAPRQAPAAAAPVVVAPTAPVEAAPRPYIETAPLVVEPPTPAAPAQTNPDAPVSTAPQPLN